MQDGAFLAKNFSHSDSEILWASAYAPAAPPANWRPLDFEPVALAAASHEIGVQDGVHGNGL